MFYTAGRQAGGMLVLAGILATEFNGVARAYGEQGWKLVTDRHVKEWRSGAFCGAG